MSFTIQYEREYRLGEAIWFSLVGMNNGYREWGQGSKRP